MIAGIANALFATVGTAVAAVLGACGVRAGESYFDSIDVLCAIDIGLFFTILAVEIVSALKISDSTFHTVCIAGSMLGYCLFSVDFANMLARRGMTIVMQAFDCANFVFFELAVLSIVWFRSYTYKFAFGRGLRIAAYVAAAACAGLYVGLSFVGLAYVANALFLACFAVLVGFACRSFPRTFEVDPAFFATETLLYLLLGARTAVTLCGSAIDFTPFGFTSIASIVAVFLFVLVYVAFAMRVDLAALKASEYRLQYEQTRSAALRAQIKPHFIFNSLAAIQSLYHKSLEDGDRATSLFSRHLRANVEAADVDMIPFERELDNVQVFVDLENMRFEKPFNVIFDVDETDFRIPVLSLQPYVENAMRYSRVNEKPDGYIRISTRAEEGCVVLEIADNGVGFDVGSVAPTSCGLRNACERFAVLMGIEPQIASVPGEGTTVTVRIPCGGGRSFDENHHHRRRNERSVHVPERRDRGHGRGLSFFSRR